MVDYIVAANVDMAYIGMIDTVEWTIALCLGLHSYCLYRNELDSYRLYSYGPYDNGPYDDGLYILRLCEELSVYLWFIELGMYSYDIYM